MSYLRRTFFVGEEGAVGYGKADSSSGCHVCPGIPRVTRMKGPGESESSVWLEGLLARYEYKDSCSLWVWGLRPPS